MVFDGFRNLGQEFIIYTFLRCIHEYIYRIAILRLREETYRLSRSERIGMVAVAERIGVRERERRIMHFVCLVVYIASLLTWGSERDWAKPSDLFRPVCWSEVCWLTRIRPCSSGLKPIRGHNFAFQGIFKCSS